MEKIAFTLVVTSRKLRPYFQVHSIVVMTDQLIRKTMSKIDAIGRNSRGNWIGLIWHQISASSSNQSPSTSRLHHRIHLPLQGRRTPHGNMDSPNRGVYHKESRRVRAVLISLEREILKYAVRLQFSATNNEAEYEALLTGLSLAKALGPKNLITQVDS